MNRCETPENVLRRTNTHKREEKAPTGDLKLLTGVLGDSEESGRGSSPAVATDQTGASPGFENEARG